MATLIVAADDVLSGTVDLDGLDAMYVALRGSKMLTGDAFVRLLEAVNYMAKFGWRVRAWFQYYVIMEKEK